MTWRLNSRWWVRVTDAYLVALLVHVALWATVGESLWPVFILIYVTPFLALPAPFLLVVMLRQRERLRSLVLVPIVVLFIWPIMAQFLPADNEGDNLPAMHLTVMTYNVGNGLAQPEQLVALLRASDADVIGLEELTSTQAEAISKALTDEYPYQVLYGLGIPGKGLLSRFPISNAEQLRLDPDRPDLRAAINVNGLTISVIVAHPAPPRFQTTGFHITSATRQHIDGLREAATSDGPTIMMGDFNFTEWHQSYRQFVGAGLQDAFRTVSHDPGYTIPARIRAIKAIPIMRIDYIWITPHFRAQSAWVGPDAGSDHLPVFARLAMPAPES